MAGRGCTWGAARRRFASLVMLGAMVAAGGCNLRPVSPPPARAMRSSHPVDWRTLVGCWRMTAVSLRPELVAFDSVLAPEPRAVRGGPPRRARTLPRADPTSEETWRITERNTVQYVDHAGWGSTWEFVVRGDSLAGRMHVHPDLPGYEPSRIRAAAVRAPCPQAPPRSIDRERE